LKAPAEIGDLLDQMDAAERDAEALVAGLSSERGAWRAAPGSWSVAECLDHLAMTNRLYLDAMREPAARARSEGRLRRGEARPGLVGGWFVRSLEPPVKQRHKAPKKIQPRSSSGVADAFARFAAAQGEVRAFLLANADLDLAGVRFPNPFIPGVRFSLATGLHAIPAHERRHLWQAWRARKAAELEPE
jgi:hypothetical protein